MSYKEIVTRAVLGKGKKKFITNNSIKLEHTPSTILGCWIINHNFKGDLVGDKVNITGSYDVNIWYSYNDNKETLVTKNTDTYNETVTIKDVNADASAIIKCLSGPTCTNASISGNTINYTVEKELGIELVGDQKVKIGVVDEEDPWDEILDNPDEKIDEVKEDYLEDNTIKEKETNDTN